MSNKKYKKCFCVEEVDETNNPNSDDIENVGIDESLLRIDDDDDQIVVGGQDRYLPVCRYCYYKS